MKSNKLFFYAIVFACVTSSCTKQMEQSSMAVNGFESASKLSVASVLSLPPVQTPVTVTINSNTGGFLQALPGDYASTTTKYPLIISLAGNGQLGNGSTAALASISTNSIPLLIKNNQFPANFTVGGQTYSFIVISPQFKAWTPSTSANDVRDVLNYAVSHYRIDTTRIYIAGLSMGGGSTWLFASNYAARAAAIVPMAGAQSLMDPGAQNIANASLAVWAFHNNGDPTVNPNFTYSWVARINKYHDPIVARQTIFTSTSHDCWTAATNPNYRETINGISKNIYEWMLTYHR